MSQKSLSKFLGFVVISLFLVSTFALAATTFALTETTVDTPSDTNLVAEPMHILQSAQPFNSPQGYSPSQIKTAYDLPSTGGSGTTIAIIDAYNTSSIYNDLKAFSIQFSLPLPTSSNFEIYNMSTNLLPANSDWANETCIDVEWAHAIAPNAKILLVQATDDGNGLLAAINYATSRSDVAAISMSWGMPESEFTSASDELSLDANFVSSYGAVFFASSGDSGSSSGVNWPACSPNVVAVGGTTLNLNPDGTVISETTWSGSGGGISRFEAMPNYQINSGLNSLLGTTNRTVPDVSYDANPSTGVPIICNGVWWTFGGTSIGAPQWAAIEADGLSATNANLYADAKMAYSSYFRDIKSGPSNGLYSAHTGYDLVTGLGSPISFLTVSSSSGPAGANITLGGTGFTGSSVNISYLNPANESWIPIVNNYPTYSQSFSCPLNAPDLLQSNSVGDNTPVSDKIIFRAADTNGNSYNTTIPYIEWRRGLTQVADDSAVGLYGNNTDLSTSAFIQNGQSINVAGEWFNPGTVSLLWDGMTSLGTVATDGNGFFNATVQVPTTIAGPHTLTISDTNSNSCVNVTRLPQVTNNVTAGWQTSPITVNLTPDYNGVQTYYQINNGPVETVSANDQPVVTSEGADNTLEYWGVWNVYGNGSVTLPSVTLTGIELEATPPQGSLEINGGSSTTASTNVTLNIVASSASGPTQMRFSNDAASLSQATWIPYTSSETWQLTSGDGAKTVYCQIQDNAGLTTTLNSSITLSTQQTSPNVSPSETSSPSPQPTSSPTPRPSASPTATPTPSPSTSPSPEPAKPLQTPEISIQFAIILLALLTTLFAVNHKRKHNSANVQLSRVCICF